MSLSFYQSWQNKFSTHSVLKYFWQFWGADSVVLFVPVFLYVITLPTAKQIIILSFLALAFSRGLVKEAIYFFYKKQRPYQKYNLRPPEFSFFSFTTDRADSFPSGHPMALASIATVVLYFSFWLGIVIYIVTILTAWGRVLIAYHYPEDIVGGFILGCICGGFVLFLYTGGYLPNMLNLVK